MYSFTCVYGVNYALAYSRLTPANFAYMYNMAANGEISKLATAMARGLNINAVNENGDTVACVAARRYDTTAYKTFVRLGADFDNVQTCRDNILQLYLTNRFDYDNWGAVVMPTG